jgi:hypothetical protein
LAGSAPTIQDRGVGRDLVIEQPSEEALPGLVHETGYGVQILVVWKRRIFIESLDPFGDVMDRIAISGAVETKDPGLAGIGLSTAAAVDAVVHNRESASALRANKKSGALSENWWNLRWRDALHKVQIRRVCR